MTWFSSWYKLASLFHPFYRFSRFTALLTFCSDISKYSCLLCSPNRRGIKRRFCLTSICLSRKSGLTREQRPRKSKVKGQGHQAALVGCTGRPTWTYSNGDLSICVHDVYRVTTCRPGRGHISWRPPAYSLFLKIWLNEHTVWQTGSYTVRMNGFD